VAPFWIARGAIHARHVREGIRDMQELTIGSGGASLETSLYLPLHRTGDYKLTLKAQADQPTAARVAVLTEQGRRLGEISVPIGVAASESEHSIRLDRAGHAPGDASVLRLEFDQAATVSLTRILLFPADHVQGWEPEVVRFLREARLPMLRFPGGNFVSGYHWEDGVGPLDGRPALPNPAWAEVEWNHVGTDDWLRLCKLVGAEPFICVNAGNGSSEEARRWVEYCNGSTSTPMGRLRAANGHPEPYGVRHWEIGNELYGKWQIGHTDGPGYAERYARFVKAMRAADPNLRIVANGHSAAGWNAALVERNGSDVRSISDHPLIGGGVPADADPIEVWHGLVAFADGYAERVRTLIAEPMRRARLEPKVAVTEMQIFTNRPSLPNNKSIAEALWLASLLHTAFRSDGLIELITHSALLNHGGGLGKNRSIVFADPAWWTTHLYSSQSGAIPVAVRLDSPTFSTTGKYITRRDNVAYLDAAALLDPEKATLAAFLINRHTTEAFSISLALHGAEAGATARRSLLAADSILTRNTWDSPDTVRPVDSDVSLSSRIALPPMSLTRLSLRLRQAGK
jgi:alpha-N-arabinofuranosidase